MAFWKKIVVILISLILLLIVLFFSFRNIVLHKMIENQQAALEKSHHVNLLIGKSGFYKLTNVYFTKITIIPEQGDTLLQGDSISVNFRLFPLFTGKFRLNFLGLFDFKLFLINKAGRNNYSAFFKNESRKDTSVNHYSNYSDVVNRLLNKAFSAIPKKVIVDKFQLSLLTDSISSNVTFQNLKMEDNKCDGMIYIKEKLLQSQIEMRATIDRSKKTIGINLSGINGQMAWLPFLGPKYHTLANFDNLNLLFSSEGFNDGLLNLKGKISVEGMTVNNKKLAPSDIEIDSGMVNFNILVGERFFELDSSSFISFNKISFKTFFRYQGLPQKQIRFRILPTTFDSQLFFESLPSGMFTTLEGIKTEGKLTFHSNFMFDFQDPDSLIFDTKLEKHDFRVISYGKEDFRKINGSFIHEVYEKDRFVREFIVGPENPGFTPLEQISPFLRNAILTSEDGDFFYHHGFNERTFRESIAMDIKEGRFVRGGSTITMQLVKNVFLTRNKTVSRKLEEAMIVWLMENLRLVSKERMYEVYLNIIEFGPGVYGIKEASYFYFNKKPSELNLAESIYLSTIIPRPKAFKYSFDEKGKLKGYIADYFKRAVEIMLRRNQITPYDTLDLKPAVDLRGPARSFLVFSNDSILPEQLEPDDEGF